MSRPQTENLNAFDVSKTNWQPEGLPDGAEIRVLNEDPDGGAISGLVHLPKGWSWEGPGVCGADLDLFVFEGVLRQGGHEMPSGGFSFYPAGVLQNGWEAIEDCSLYMIFNDRPVFHDVPSSLTGATEEKTVPFIDTWDMDWIDPNTASEPSNPLRPGIFVKMFRTDPETGVSTYFAGMMPGWYQEGIEIHPVREESLVISGDVNIATVNGDPGYTCRVGGFYSRPAGIPHGPISTKNGNVGIIHSTGLLGIDYQNEPKSKDMIFDHFLSHPWH